MEEVFELADRISVLRDGKFIGCVKTNEVSSEELLRVTPGITL